MCIFNFDTHLYQADLLDTFYNQCNTMRLHIETLPNQESPLYGLKTCSPPQFGNDLNNKNMVLIFLVQMSYFM